METRADISPDAGARAPATAILVNRQSGTVRSMGEEAARALLSEAFDGKAVLYLVSGAEVEQTVRDVLASGRFTQIVVGGGDGTVASVGGMLAGSGIAMGILPMGTMNMMAKALGMSADLGEALSQLETANQQNVDAARAGERLFLHHISFGLQPRIVRIRERLGYSTRLTKMLSTTRALLSVLLRPKSHRLALEIDGRSRLVKSPALFVSNNIYEDSAWLKQAVLDEGLLGIYALLPMSRLALLRLALDLLRGRWRENLNIAEEHGREVTLHISRRRFGRLRRRIWASIDGELVLLDLPLRIRSEPGALRMLVPAPTAAEPSGGT